MIQKKIYSQDDVFSCIYVFVRCILRICINLKIKLKKKPSIKYIKKSILNTTQKNFLQKHYSFNRYDQDKFLIFTIIFLNMQKRISIFKQVNQIFLYH